MATKRTHRRPDLPPDYTTPAQTIQALADPTRLWLIDLLRAHPDGMAVHQIVSVANKAQATISHHLALLARAGVATRAKDGILSVYTLDQARLDELAVTIVKGVA